MRRAVDVKLIGQGLSFHRRNPSFYKCRKRRMRECVVQHMKEGEVGLHVCGKGTHAGTPLAYGVCMHVGTMST